jgi:hypothetical protein
MDPENKTRQARIAFRMKEYLVRRRQHTEWELPNDPAARG